MIILDHHSWHGDIGEIRMFICRTSSIVRVPRHWGVLKYWEHPQNLPPLLAARMTIAFLHLGHGTTDGSVASTQVGLVFAEVGCIPLIVGGVPISFAMLGPSIDASRVLCGWALTHRESTVCSDSDAVDESFR